jgi:hypothetical protein
VKLEGLVSTIVPVHNRPELLKQAVASVLSQTYRPVEVVIVDDGSTDDTASVCEALSRQHPGEVVTTRRSNGGPGAARETGRRLARGEFLQYLDSDDWLDPHKFERQVAALRSRPECDVAYCIGRETWRDEEMAPRPAKRSNERFERLFPMLLEGRIWPTVSPLYRRSLTDRVGPWTELRQEEDWEYDARVAASGARLAWCGEELAEFRHHSGARAGGGSTGNAVKMSWRVTAHTLIYDHARRAGIGPDDPCMQHFARELFLIARQAGAAGLGRESRALFELARVASTPVLAGGTDFRLYWLAALAIGWSNAGRIACWIDSVKSRVGSQVV